MTDPGPKLAWAGEVVSVQPRIRLTRSFEERSHSYLGYSLRVRGMLAGEPREFVVAVGKAAHAKHQFRAGDRVEGQGVLVGDPGRETADLHKVSGLKRTAQGGGSSAGPPFVGVPPELEVYRERGHRRLAAATYASRCLSCLWGCEMAVAMIIDPWKPSVRRTRRETFCYGPKSCPIYKGGPTGRSRAGRGCPGKRRTGWTRTPPRTGTTDGPPAPPYLGLRSRCRGLCIPLKSFPAGPTRDQAPAPARRGRRRSARTANRRRVTPGEEPASTPPKETAR